METSDAVAEPPRDDAARRSFVGESTDVSPERHEFRRTGRELTFFRGSGGSVHDDDPDEERAQRLRELETAVGEYGSDLRDANKTMAHMRDQNTTLAAKLRRAQDELLDRNRTRAAVAAWTRLRTSATKEKSDAAPTNDVDDEPSVDADEVDLEERSKRILAENEALRRDVAKLESRVAARDDEIHALQLAQDALRNDGDGDRGCRRNLGVDMEAALTATPRQSRSEEDDAEGLRRHVARLEEKLEAVCALNATFVGRLRAADDNDDPPVANEAAAVPPDHETPPPDRASVVDCLRAELETYESRVARQRNSWETRVGTAQRRNDAVADHYRRCLNALRAATSTEDDDELLVDARGADDDVAAALRTELDRVWNADVGKTPTKTPRRDETNHDRSNDDEDERAPTQTNEQNNEEGSPPQNDETEEVRSAPQTNDETEEENSPTQTNDEPAHETTSLSQTETPIELRSPPKHDAPKHDEPRAGDTLEARIETARQKNEAVVQRLRSLLKPNTISTTTTTTNGSPPYESNDAPQTTTTTTTNCKDDVADHTAATNVLLQTQLDQQLERLRQTNVEHQQTVAELQNTHQEELSTRDDRVTALETELRALQESSKEQDVAHQRLVHDLRAAEDSARARRNTLADAERARRRDQDAREAAAGALRAERVRIARERDEARALNDKLRADLRRARARTPSRDVDADHPADLETLRRALERKEVRVACLESSLRAKTAAAEKAEHARDRLSRQHRRETESAKQYHSSMRDGLAERLERREKEVAGLEKKLRAANDAARGRAGRIKVLENELERERRERRRDGYDDARASSTSPHAHDATTDDTTPMKPLGQAARVLLGGELLSPPSHKPSSLAAALAASSFASSTSRRHHHRRSSHHDHPTPTKGLTVDMREIRLRVPPTEVDVSDALNSDRWVDVDLVDVVRRVLHEPDADALRRRVRTRSVREFGSSSRRFWYSVLRAGAERHQDNDDDHDQDDHDQDDNHHNETSDSVVWDPSTAKEQQLCSVGLVGTRMGHIVYDSRESAEDALLFYVLRATDPRGAWTDGLLRKSDRSCLLRKTTTSLSEEPREKEKPWVALIRKGPHVFLVDVLDDVLDNRPVCVRCRVDATVSPSSRPRDCAASSHL